MEEVVVEEKPGDWHEFNAWSLLEKKNEVNPPATDVQSEDDTEPPSPQDFEAGLPQELKVKLEKIEKSGSITGLLQCTDEEFLV